MEIGCRARMRVFDRRRYWYLWHDEREDGVSRRQEDYVGRAASARARQGLLRRMAAYHRRAEQEFAWKREAAQVAIDRLAHTST